MLQDPEQMQCPCCWKDFIPHNAIVDGEMMWQEFTSKKCSACGCVFSIRGNEVEAYPVLDCGNPNTECSCEDHNDNVCTQWEQDQKNKVIAQHDPYTTKIQERLEAGIALARDDGAVLTLMNEGYVDSARILCGYLADDLWDCGTSIGRNELIDAMIENCLYEYEHKEPTTKHVVAMTRLQLCEILHEGKEYDAERIVRDVSIQIGNDTYPPTPNGSCDAK